MFRLSKFVAATLSVLAMAAAASAQIGPISLVTWKFRQPWTQPYAAHPSVVRDCQGGPVQFSTVAFDDWLCTRTGPIRRIMWWGTSPQPQQVPNRQFVISVYTDANCRPGNLLYRTCVLATNTLVGIDCRDRRVYRFVANMPTGAAGWSQVAGTKYWLQISEADNAGMPMQSPTPNAVDFQWSAHRPIQFCPALKRAPGGAFQLCLDPCDQIEEDLSFVLYSTAIIGHVSVPGSLKAPGQPSPFMLELRRPGDNEIVARIPISADVNGDGEIAVCDEEDFPVGEYLCRITSHGTRPKELGLISFEQDAEVNLGAITLSSADSNGDGLTNFSDIVFILSNFGM